METNSPCTHAGRGRGRARLNHHQDAGHHAAKPGPGKRASLGNGRPAYNEHDERHTDDDGYSERKGAVRDRAQFSDKENSRSPQMPRVQRPNFDAGVMSMINKHLRKGNSERSDAGTPKQKEASSSATDRSRSDSPKSGRGSPTLRLVIPSNVTSGVQFAAALRRKMAAAGERPRSATDPTPMVTNSDFPGGGGGGRAKPGDGEMASSSPRCVSVELDLPGLLSDSRSMSPASVLNDGATGFSTSTPVKGRGRGRGRARRRDGEMASAPGAAQPTGGGGDTNLPLNQHTLDTGSFADAETSGCGATDVGQSETDAGQGCGTDVGGDGVAGDDQKGLDASPASETVVREETRGDKRVGKLTVDVSGVGSPGGDDMDLLLSPDHEFVLDWAAAMETPTPDTSGESPPDWNVSDR